MSIQALSALSSGLATASSRVGRAADNIVNATTPGYAARTGQAVSVAPAGVRDIDTGEGGEVDVMREVVELMQSKTAYGAVAKTFAKVARMDAAVLDIIA